ncbi:hypothetical protein [Paenibacillus barengoltzii]
MEYIVPMSHEAGSGGGGDCKGYCYTKETYCPVYGACGTLNVCIVKW